MMLLKKNEMKKYALLALFALAVGFGYGCDNKGGNPNLSTPTEKIGSGEGEPLNTHNPDSADVNAHQASDSAELSTGAPEETE